ncbi:hypothetical protein TNCT_56791 [Trichonephila clavata]|uniref:Uncharacterized protein n=1 Tax=Trichonephila clavata TaxID=2740835 RepID=A0A8X6LHW3_TRICU|nr:hypothetical protein TNCT_56791 [Trichonephila clavata]
MDLTSDQLSPCVDIDDQMWTAATVLIIVLSQNEKFLLHDGDSHFAHIICFRTYSRFRERRIEAISQHRVSGYPLRVGKTSDC